MNELLPTWPPLSFPSPQAALSVSDSASEYESGSTFTFQTNLGPLLTSLLVLGVLMMEMGREAVQEHTQSGLPTIS